MAALLAGLTLASCSTKQHAINQLESFSYELRDHSARYDVQDWQHAAEKFVKIRKNISVEICLCCFNLQITK